MRDPLLLGLLPAIWALWAVLGSFAAIGVLGFDFLGTVWRPARAFLDGMPMYPEPTRAAVELGNPAVYPPLVPVLASPLALLPGGLAEVPWVCALAASTVLALWLLGVRDWRCYALAFSASPVISGLFWGNVTLLLVLPLAVAWRYRDVVWIAGLSVGAAIAAKLFLWPLAVWLLCTRRWRAAAWALASAVALILGPWALVGFDGLRQYPALLSVLQDVYAVRSFSVSTVVSALGVSPSIAIVVAGAGGLALLAVAASLARRENGDARSFAMVVVASIVATPIVWPYYAALLLVPIAALRPRLAPVWFFGVALGVVSMLPAYSLPVPEPCCRPEDVPRWVWAVSQTTPEPWQAMGALLVLGAVALILVVGREVRSPLTGRDPRRSPRRAQHTPHGPTYVGDAVDKRTLPVVVWAEMNASAMRGPIGQGLAGALGDEAT